jgi:hypothetical protein
LPHRGIIEEYKIQIEKKPSCGVNPRQKGNIYFESFSNGNVKTSQISR